MDTELTNTIGIIAFIVAIGFLAIISLLAMYVFIRYGQPKRLTVFFSLIFAGVFILGALTTFWSLTKLF